MPFTHYRIGSIDASQCGTADTANFPLLVFIGASIADDLKSIANGGHVAESHGYDIRPFADAAFTQPLTYERVVYNQTNGVFEMYVKIPNLSHTVNGVIYLAYGDPTLTTDGSSSAMWDPNYKGVWHFRDNGLSVPLLDDSTSNANNGTNHGATGVGGPSFVSSAAAHFVAASSQYADMGSGSSLAITGALTIEGWIYIDSVTGFPRFLGREAVASNLGYAIYYGFSNFWLRIYTGTAISDLSSLSALATGTWAHIAGTIDASRNAAVYLNGVQDNTGVLASLPTDSLTPLLLAARNDLARFHDGSLDEVRISNIDRSPSYFTALYNNANPSGGTLLTWSPALPVSSAIAAPADWSRFPRTFMRRTN